MSTTRALFIMLGASFVMLAVALALSAAGGQESLAADGIIYVDADATGDNDGTSWDHAFTDLQAALDAAVARDQIWVAAGTYKPTQESSPGDPRSATFQMKNGVALYGGFDPSVGDIAFEDRDWVGNITTLSGDIGAAGDTGDNSYHVFYHPSELALDGSAVLDGFTVSGGNADGVGDSDSGGGMYNRGSSPAVTNCTFSGNSAWSGGGMRNQSSLPVVTNCTFSGNSAGGVGGGMWNEHSSPTVTNCTFSGNSAYEGAGMANYFSGSMPTVTNCILWGDSPDEISALWSQAVITYSDIQGGWAGTGNIDVDPSFVDSLSGDYHLGPGSPCIDAGTNDAPNLPNYDFEGDPRILDGNGDGTATVDMGVDEVLGITPYVIYVDQDAAGDDNGTSWEDAFTDLQPALDTAQSGDQIWVAEGTYTPTQESFPDDPRSATFQMKNGVALYGGFDPSVGDIAFEDRDWVTHATILSGDIGTEGDDSDNSYHVFYHPSGTDLDSTAILDGFTITAGNADGVGDSDSGGGMFNESSSPTLTNCTFASNSAIQGGGGMYNFDSSPALNNCTFSGNESTLGGGILNTSNSTLIMTDCIFEGNSAYRGGGVRNVHSSPGLIDCTFEGNSAAYGAGMHNYYSSPTLANCTFSGNSATNGSGMYNEDSSPTLTHCTFSHNGQSSVGGGMCNEDSSPTLSDCTFADNSAIFGGGMYNIDSAPTLTDCTFSGNRGAFTAGGMDNRGSSPTLTNCTFQGNLGRAMFNQGSSPVLTNCTFSGNFDGGIANCGGSVPKLTNSIMWGDGLFEISGDPTDSPVVTYSDIQGGYEGEGNIDADPRFVDSSNGDFHLRPCSPCIDAGSNDAPDLAEVDFEGDDRILDGNGDGTATVDMGVDEVAVAGTCFHVYLPVVVRNAP